jgi:multidrug efflux pump subunit AcrB
MHEITGAIISITLVMAAVFLPVSFMTGSAGIFYQAVCIDHVYRYHHIGC